MLYREIMAVCSETHTKHIKTLCGQNVEFVNVKPGGTYSDHWALNGSTALHILTTDTIDSDTTHSNAYHRFLLRGPQSWLLSCTNWASQNMASKTGAAVRSTQRGSTWQDYVANRPCPRAKILKWTQGCHVSCNHSLDGWERACEK
jgi:hypothetical protein